MIVAEQKPFEEIKSMVEGYERILVAGCNTCTAVCFAGGEKEVGILASALTMTFKIDDKSMDIQKQTVQRQCEWEFLDELREKIDECEVILSMGCGAGVNAIAERFPDKIVFPALDTKFIGITEAPGVWAERCRACGKCILDATGGVCPLARCAKGLLNGPCGGSQDGKCEISPDVPCAWHLIYERMKKLNSLSKLSKIIMPKDWSAGAGGGPGKVTREDLQL